MNKKENTIYIDMITTNYNGQPDDADVNDVVKITIIDDNRKILLNTYVYPCHATSEAWEIALCYNDIPNAVINRASNIDVVVANVRDIVAFADNIVMYNVDKVRNYFQKWEIAPITIIDVSAKFSKKCICMMPLLPLPTIARDCNYFTSMDDYVMCRNHHDTYQYAMMLRHIYHHTIR